MIMSIYNSLVIVYNEEVFQIVTFVISVLVNYQYLNIFLSNSTETFNILMHWLTWPHLESKCLHFVTNFK